MDESIALKQPQSVISLVVAEDILSAEIQQFCGSDLLNAEGIVFKNII